MTVQMLKNKVSHKVISFVMLLIIGVEMLAPSAIDITAEIGLGQLYFACPNPTREVRRAAPCRLPAPPCCYHAPRAAPRPATGDSRRALSYDGA